MKQEKGMSADELFAEFLMGDMCFFIEQVRKAEQEEVSKLLRKVTQMRIDLCEKKNPL